MPELAQGVVEPGWEGVREAFETNLAGDVEVGAAVSVHHEGRKVVDLWGGSFDAARTQPYAADTLQLVFSTTKGVTAVMLAMLIDRGELDPDATVASYWPEFAAEGKGDITVAQLVSHQAGLVYTDAKLSIEDCLDWPTVTAALAAQKPLWEPGTKHGYHALTYGWLAGELIRRISGLTPGQMLAKEIAEPLGLELWIGLPEAEEHRVSPMIAAPPPAPEVAQLMEMMMGPDTMVGRALSMNGAFNDLGGGEMSFNTRRVHAAEIPAANGIGTARALSRLYAATVAEVDGIRLVSPEVVQRASTTLTSGPDACLMLESTFGLGFMTTGPMTPMAGPGSFGHAGAGGSLAFGHQASGLGFAYVMNQMDLNLAGDLRAQRLVDAAVAAAG
jgi:CubicO group peptidase (beta-lactamase class C family)